LALTLRLRKIQGHGGNIDEVTMPRKPLKLKKAKKPLTPDELAYLTDDPTADGDDYTLWCYQHGMRGFDGDFHPKELWESNKNEYLPLWIKKHPCTRCLAWWQWDAPRWSDHYEDCFFHRTLPEPRKRIGGTGTPNYEVLSYVPEFFKGVPTRWITKFEEDYFNERCKGVDKKPIVTKYHDGDFEGIAIDPDDLPTFESEASYLQRHGLLTPEEKKYLAKHQELMEPEKIKLEE
jgi:hypothetical protein